MVGPVPPRAVRTHDSVMRFEPKLLAVTLWLLAANAVAPANAGAQCRAADSTGAQMLGKYKSNLRRSSTDFDMQQWLIRNGIPLVDPSTVVLVTDRYVCSEAMKAYNATVSGNGVTPFGSVYVVKIGTVYVVKDPVQVSSGWTSKWSLIASSK